MKILVPIKRVVDYNVKVRVKPDGSGVDLDNVKMSMNPFCEIAVEAALQLKEKGQASEVAVVTIGSAACVDTLRAGLAMGADRALHVPFDGITEPLAVAKTLAAIIKAESPQLVILGKQAIDDDCNQTGQMLSALLGWPQATFASSITLDGDKATVVREIDGGLETLQATLPAIITTDLRLNHPRYASLPNIMKARQKPIETMQAADFGVDLTPKLQTTHVAEPAKRSAGIKVPDVATLIDKLRNEAKVI